MAIRKGLCCGRAKSLRKLGRRLAGYSATASVSHSVRSLLGVLGYSLQANRKTREGTNHPDRDAQFGYINDQREGSACRRRAGDLGRYQEEGTGRRLQERRPRMVSEGRAGGGAGPRLPHPRQLGRAVPYGIYDIGDNAGWVSVGVDHDTASFAVNAIRRWWQLMGATRYPEASQSPHHGRRRWQQWIARCGLWKVELQKLADELDFTDHCLPLSAGHQQVEQDRAPPLLVHHPATGAANRSSAIRSLSSSSPPPPPKPASRCVPRSIPSPYPAGIKIADADLARVNL